MKENIIYFRKGGVNHKGLFMKKSSGTTKMYKVCKKDKFLRATSGASIDTGYIWQSNNVKMEIKFTNLTISSATVFGAEDRTNESTATSGKYSLIGHTSLYNGLRMGWYIGKKAGLGNSGSYPLDDIHTMIIETDNLNGKVICTLDGDAQVYNDRDATIVNKTVSNTIFSSHFYPNTFTQFAPCDVFYCKMWDNGILVRDLHPVKSGQTLNGTTFTSDGMYDRVNKRFYGNASGNGTITYIEQ